MKINKSKELRRAFQRWVDHTTLHGITYIYDSSSLLVKFIWTVVFCGFFAFACWLLSNSFTTFFNYEIATSVSRLKVNEITFPAVTFCNLYYSTDINGKNYSAAVIKQIDDLNRFCYMKENIEQYNISLFDFDKTGGKNYKSFFGEEKIGLDWSEMVVGCYFMNSDCHTVYEEVISPRYGRCYTSKDSGQICNIKSVLLFLFCNNS
jgi:hypothetical protein